MGLRTRTSLATLVVAVLGCILFMNGGALAQQSVEPDHLNPRLTEIDGVELQREVRRAAVTLDRRDLAEMARTPHTNSLQQVAIIEGTAWNRLVGQREFFLTPVIRDFEAYHDRISSGTDKSDPGARRRSVAHIRVTATARRDLAEIGFEVPGYAGDSVLIYVTRREADDLAARGHQIEFDAGYEPRLELLDAV